MLGAEVDFYIAGMEDKHEEIIALLQKFYENSPKEYAHFSRYEKEKLNVTTPPWYNKEIFIKLYKEEEGRNFDNGVPYPLIGIQLRLDAETQKPIIFEESKAQNYLRY